MRTLSADTPPEIERIQIEIIRRLPSWKKFAAVDDLNEMVKALAISGIKQDHPQASPEQIRRILMERMLGVELVTKVYNRAR